jgi:hypothetical protein
MKGWIRVALLAAPLAASVGGAQVLTLPDGSDTRWTVEEPEEIVAYVLFDPATVEDRLRRHFTSSRLESWRIKDCSGRQDT